VLEGAEREVPTPVCSEEEELGWGTTVLLSQKGSGDWREPGQVPASMSLEARRLSAALYQLPKPYRRDGLLSLRVNDREPEKEIQLSFVGCTQEELCLDGNGSDAVWRSGSVCGTVGGVFGHDELEWD
jgi:hypothetical protein